MSSPPAVKAEQKKRKRQVVPSEIDNNQLEIDVNLPEPPSKKAKRKEKKGQSRSSGPVEKNSIQTTVVDGSVHPERKSHVLPKHSTEPEKRSDHGIWIGNLSYKTTKDSLRKFLLDRGGVDETSISRTHMPTNDQKQNKGFAYVDFATEAILNIALGLSEKLLDGRKVLIKNSKDFVGRPAKTNMDEDKAANGHVSTKAPSKRVFVGNLGFDMTKEELSDHFAQAGQVDDVFLATFEDTGKCKGFGWVTFADIEAAEKAVKGFIYKEQSNEEDDGGEEVEEEEEIVENDSDSKDEKKPKIKRKPKKPMKWFINKIHGRMLRCEFAEDKKTRYLKRYGKGSTGALSESNGETENTTAGGAELDGEENLQDLISQAAAAREMPKQKKDSKLKKLSRDQRQEVRRKKHDARMTAPGQALANAQRVTGAIVKGAGKKVTFD